MLAKLYNLGIILISSTKFATSNNEDILPLNYSDNGEYYFIKSPGKRKNEIPKYRLIVDDKNNSKFIFTELKSNLKILINSTKTITGKGYTLEKYLKEFKPVRYVKKARKKKTKLKLTKEKKDGN